MVRLTSSQVDGEYDEPLIIQPLLALTLGMEDGQTTVMMVVTFAVGLH